MTKHKKNGRGFFFPGHRAVRGTPCRYRTLRSGTTFEYLPSW
jgi:hypothetical protein